MLEGMLAVACLMCCVEADALSKTISMVLDPEILIPYRGFAQTT
jgi:hypothetical protein